MWQVGLIFVYHRDRIWTEKSHISQSYQIFWDLEDLKEILPKILVGMVSPCISDVVCVWYCLIGRLVIMHGHVTCMLAGLNHANESYIIFSCSYISHVCSFLACILHPSSMTQSLIRDSSTSNMVCCCYNNPTNYPTGDPSVAGLPWGLQKHAILACL